MGGPGEGSGVQLQCHVTGQPDWLTVGAPIELPGNFPEQQVYPRTQAKASTPAREGVRSARGEHSCATNKQGSPHHRMNVKRYSQ